MFEGGFGNNRTGHQIYEGKLYALYILNTFQRKGVGKLLVKSFINKLIDKRFRKMIVWGGDDKPTQAN